MTLNADKANTMAVLRPQVRLTQGSEPGPARFTARIQRSRAVAPYSEYSLALAQPCLSDQAQSAVGPGLLGSAVALGRRERLDELVDLADSDLSQGAVGEGGHD